MTHSQEQSHCDCSHNQVQSTQAMGNNGLQNYDSQERKAAPIYCLKKGCWTLLHQVA